MTRLLIILGLCVNITVFAQTSEKYNSEYAGFYRAEELYEKEQFAAARMEFRAFIDQLGKPNDPMYVKARYYEGISALELSNNDAVALLEKFNADYPESIYHKEIFFRLGKFFYHKSDFNEALIWFNKLSVKDVSTDNQSEFLFKLGYANFQEKNYDAARSAFHDIKDDSTQYSTPALYFYSHIAYMNEGYPVAEKGFLTLMKTTQFSSIAPYYLAQIYYLQREYEKVIDIAPSVMDTSKVFNQNDMNHLVGDSYYRLNKFSEAVPYLEAYNKNAQTTRDDDYQLGYACYRSGLYDKAARMFDRVANGKKDSLAQVALYHTAESRMKQNNLASARSAFGAAAAINVDPKIQEDALYNFAVLSYKLDINPFNDAVEAFESFLTEFPDSKRRDEVNQYLVNVYSSTNNYAKALESLDKLPNKDSRLKTVYQLVAFNYGVDYFQKGDLKSALTMFERVNQYPVDAAISAKARFWASDAHFRLDDMDKAIKGYREFISMPAAQSSGLKADAYYNMGYAYLKKNDITQSTDAFRIYCQSSVKDKRKLSDAYMRVGDGYFATKQDELAVKSYQEVVRLASGYEDQALFYMARAYGYMGNDDLKAARLLDILSNHKDSKYTLKSLYDVALTYKSKEQFDKAEMYLKRIMDEYPNSDLVVDCRIERADIHFKKHDFRQSELEYKQILTEHGEDRTVCEKSVRGLMDIYAALRQPEKVSDIATQYSCANISIEEQEGLYYSPAVEAYKDSLFAESIPLFKKYLDKFPAGRFSVDAKFFLGNSYFSLNDKENAVKAYAECLEGPNNSYTEYAASRAAQIYYNSERYVEAIPFYERVESISSKPSTVFSARLGLMRSYFITEIWSKAYDKATLVLENTGINNTIRLEGEYVAGVSSYEVKNYDLALPHFDWLVKNTTTATAAEAKYLIAEIHYAKQDYVNSDKTIRELLKMKPSYNYWTAKALILQSRVQMATDDLFQAERTLNSVINHYKTKDDGILNEANLLMQEIQQLKNQPKIVTPEGETIIEMN
ncbi:MAG: tetratricopeptide repeat protein [Flavobacteriia bacterium]